MIKVTYKELEEALKLLKFNSKKTEDTLIFSYQPLDARIKLPLPKSARDTVNGGILQGHAFILQEKGVIKKADVLFKIIEHQRYIRENVLV